MGRDIVHSSYHISSSSFVCRAILNKRKNALWRKQASTQYAGVSARRGDSSEEEKKDFTSMLTLHVYTSLPLSSPSFLLAPRF